MRNNQLKLGVLLSYLQMAANVLIQLIYTPILIRLLGSSEYGLYNTVSSSISMLSILSLGFTSGYVRFYSIYNKDNKKKEIYKLNGIYFLTLGAIATICFAIGIFLSFNLQLIFDTGLTPDEYSLARVLAIILTFNLSLTLLMGVFQHIISAHEQFVFLKMISIVRYVGAPLLTLPLLIRGHRSVAIVVVTTIVSLMVDLVYLWYVKIKLGEKFFFSQFEPGLLKAIFAFTFFIALNAIVDQINWNIDKVLLGRYKGTSEVAIYAAAYTIYQCYMVFSTSISNVFAPKVHRIVNETDHDIQLQTKRLTYIFIRVGRMQFAVLGLIASGIVFFGKFFVTRIWIGSDYVNSYYVSLLLVIPASIALIQNVGIEIQRAENKHKFRSISYTIMALTNLCLSIYLCKKYGAIGSAFGTSVSLILANGLIMNIYYHKKCNINIFHFWRSIISMMKGIIIPIIIGTVINMSKLVSNRKSFLLFVLLYTIIYFISMWLVALDKDEKQLIVTSINHWRRL